MLSAGRPYRIVLRDAAEPSYLRWLWAAGSALLSGADARIAVGTWDEAMARLRLALARVPDDVETIEVQVWGHGYPGTSLIGGERLNAGNVHEFTSLFDAFDDTRNVVWWRQCDVHGGAPGHAFAAAVAAGGLDTVGHCAVISLPYPWQQREVCGLRAGERPWWSLTGAELPACSALQMSIRPEWFAPRAR